MLAAEFSLARDTVKITRKHHLGLRKVLARWVPLSLSESRKAARVAHGREILATWGHRLSGLRSQLVTVDETWIAYDPPRQSVGEWRSPDAAAPELPRIPQDRRKSMANIAHSLKRLTCCCKTTRLATKRPQLATNRPNWASGSSTTCPMRRTWRRATTIYSGVSNRT